MVGALSGINLFRRRHKLFASHRFIVHVKFYSFIQKTQQILF